MTEEVILRLTSYCESSLGEFLFESNIPNGLQDDIISAIQHLQRSQNISIFSTNTLPPLVEVLLRRKTHSEDAVAVAQILVLVSNLLAESKYQSLAKLCSLRNMMLLGTPTFDAGIPRFVDINLLKEWSSRYPKRSFSEGLYTLHGRLNVYAKKSKMYYFWPDIWEKVLGGSMAIGHFVKVFDTDNSHWVEGKVVDFAANDESYGIEVEESLAAVEMPLLREYGGSNDCNRTANSALPHPKPSPITPLMPPAPPARRVRRFCLKACMHIWTDSSNKHTKVDSSTGGPEKEKRSHSLEQEWRKHVTFSEKDRGIFVRIWWSRYKRFFYGAIVAFDALRNEHSVVYEDGDVRAYDLSAKNLEVIVPPPDLSSRLSQAASLSDKAQIVAAWHARHLSYEKGGSTNATDLAETAIEESDTNKADTSETTEDVRFKIVSRPQATGHTYVQGISLYQLDTIEAFFAAGGADAMFPSAASTTVVGPNLSSDLIAVLSLNLELIYGLRHTLKLSYLQRLISKLKIWFSDTLLSLDDAQLKELSLKNLNKMFNLIRELLMFSIVSERTTSTQALAIRNSGYGNLDNSHQLTVQQRADVAKEHDAVDFLRLSLAAKLLRCSQLRKRYTGLAMIKDAIEAALPRVSTLIAERNNRLATISMSSASNLSKSKSLGKPAESRPASSTLHSRSLLSVDSLQEWILSNSIVDEVFGPSTHQDLVSKVDTVLVFLAVTKCLQESHLEALWRSARGVHEAVARVTYHLVLLLIPVLQPPLRIHLFALIAATPVREYSDQLLWLLKNYTTLALEVSRRESDRLLSNISPSPSSIRDTALSLSPSSSQLQQWLGFGVLWQFIQDRVDGDSVATMGPGAGVVVAEPVQQTVLGYVAPEPLIDLAVNLLVQLLQDEFAGERELVMQRCLDNVRADTSVSVSLQLLRKILVTYPAPHKSWWGSGSVATGMGVGLGRTVTQKLPTVNTVIERLQKQNHLLRVFFANLEVFRSTTQQQKRLNQSRRAMGSAPSSSTNLVGFEEASRLPSVDRRAAFHGQRHRSSHLKGTVERLEFLKCVVSNSSLVLDEAQIKLVWQALGEGATSAEALDKLAVWLEGMLLRENKLFAQLLSSLVQESDPSDRDSPSKFAFLVDDPDHGSVGAFRDGADVDGPMSNQSSSRPASTGVAFEDDALISLFKVHVLKWAIRPESVALLGRPRVASFCIKLFLLVNVQVKAIKVKADGSWNRTGTELIGLDLLWRIAVDVAERVASEAAAALLVELHHRISRKAKEGDSIRGQFLKLCFRQLSTCVQAAQQPATLLAASPPTSVPSSPTSGDLITIPPATQTAVVDLELSSTSAAEQSDYRQRGSNDDTFIDVVANAARRIRRFVGLLRSFIDRFQNAPTRLVAVQVVAGKDETPLLTVTLRSSDIIGQLRKKIADHVNESPANISIMKPDVTSISSSILGGNAVYRFENDDMTVLQAKFRPRERVIAKRREAPRVSLDPASSSPAPAPVAASSSLDITGSELLTPDDLQSDLLAELKPITWLRMLPTGDRYKLSQCSGGLPPAPLPHHPEMTLCIEYQFPTMSHSQSTASPDTAVTPDSGAEGYGSSSSGGAGTVTAILGKYISQSPQYIDQLLVMLDGSLSLADFDGSLANAPPQVPTPQADFDFPSLQADPSTSDLSADVWDILQTMPTHPRMLKAMRASPLSLSSSAASHRLPLLSSSTPYTLLYNLHIMEALIAGENDVKAGVDNSKVLANVIAWASKFLHEGGIEYLVALLSDLHEKIVPRSCEKLQRSCVDERVSKSVYITCDVSGTRVGRQDVLVLSITYLYRILHRFLLLDPMYVTWHQNILGRSQIHLFTPRSLSEHAKGGSLPAGVVLSSLSPADLVRTALSTAITMAASSQYFCGSPGALKALAENVVAVSFGLASIEDSGALSTFQQLLPVWIAEFCLRCKLVDMRGALCNAVFNAYCCVSLTKADSLSVLSSSQNAAKINLCRGVFDAMVGCVSLVQQEDVTTASRAGDLYTLLAALYTLHAIPELIAGPDTAQDLTEASIEEVSDSTIFVRFARLLHSFSQSQKSSLFLYSDVRERDASASLVGVLRVLLTITCSWEFTASKTTAPIELTAAAATSRDAEAASELIEFLYRRCLFPSNPLVRESMPMTDEVMPGPPYAEQTEDTGTSQEELYPLCQTDETRRLAYALLLALCRRNGYRITQLLDVVIGNDEAVSESQHQKIRGEASSLLTRVADRPWGYDPRTLLKDPGAHVGLVNQGATCYMNALLQQLFHIPHFTDELLKIQTEKGANINVAESLLFQLQVMFGFLKISQKRFYDTLPFCRAFTDYDGEPVSLAEQKDINEFAAMLFDKLETNTSCAALLQRYIRGTIVWHTRSTETSYKSEREENFYTITAEVKNKSSLEDSLALYVGEESFSGENKLEDPVAQKKVEAVRRCAFRVLPPTLIVHLKRFEFDLESMDRKKLNDFMSFPTTLDMYPYTEEGITDNEHSSSDATFESVQTNAISEDREVTDDTGAPDPLQVKNTGERFRRCDTLYSLRGIVAHVGAIDRGHYYSFIKDRSTGNWLEFNDKSVLAFSPDAIPAECFGGEEVYTTAAGTSATRLRQNNAYLLFYERKEDQQQSDIKTKPSLTDPSSTTIVGVSASITSAGVDTALGSDMCRNVFQQVWGENVEFQTDRFLYDATFFRFVWQLLQAPSLSLTMLSPPLSPSISPRPVSHHVLCAGSESIKPATKRRAMLLLLRVSLEILSRTNAPDAVHQFLDLAEMVVTSDKSLACASFVLNQLAPLHPIPIAPAGVANSSAANHGTPHRHSPWLELMYLKCPLDSFVKSFSRLLLTCVRLLCPVEKDIYHDLIDEGNSITGRAAESLSGDLAKSSSSTTEEQEEKQQQQEVRSPSTVLGLCARSAVTRVLYALLEIARQMEPELATQRSSGYNGYIVLVSLLRRIALTSYEEKRVLISLGAIHKLIISVMGLHSTVQRGHGGVIRASVDLISLLVRSLAIPAASSVSSEFARVDSDSPGVLFPARTLSPFLTPEAKKLVASSTSGYSDGHTIRNVAVGGFAMEDFRAFSNKLFLTDALTVAASAMSQALRHVRWSRGDSVQTQELIEFLTEKVLEATSSTGSQAGTSVSYRPFLSVLSDFLLNGGGGDDLFTAFGRVLPALINRAEILAIRQSPRDAEFVYVVLKMLHRAGLTDAKSHELIMRFKTAWQRVRIAFVDNKKRNDRGGHVNFNSNAITATEHSNQQARPLLAQINGGTSLEDEMGFDRCGSFY